MTTRRSRRTILKGGATALAGLALGLSRLPRFAEPAKAAGTCTLWNPMSSTCASDYAGHYDNALDFAAGAGSWVSLYFDAGPLKGAGKITNNNLWTCSAAWHADHKKVSFELYKDDGITLVGYGIAEHVIPQVQVNQWVWGGGGGFCTLGGGTPPTCPGDAECSCWTGPHVHYGANGSKLVNWVGYGCQNVTAGKTACWSWQTP